MAAVRLADLRIGFDYAVDVNFPAGFLQPGEQVRAKLRKYKGAPEAAVFSSLRTGDSISLSLTEAQTAGLEPGSYQTELILVGTPTPANDTPLSDNIYLIEVDRSPSE